MSNLTESFEDTYLRYRKPVTLGDGTKSVFKYLGVLENLERELETLRNPNKVKLMKQRIAYVKMREIMDE
ncbi:hypothetical protein NVP1152O_091 [Vibrio phage 1.152.O._10N.222.46.E1]|uniref:Uncharacterized protein n=5 Tax=Nahantvirus 49C7 TaxID=2846601 RepID=A0A2I7RBF6_9CAUD|nr:hypothetical protein HYP57_gp095 [Vibrio phage 1.026.O._10N.222.49.C7]AUR82573.1 hypothetical protein NVP1025O_090 [Vibrio phage 1.025.O._10N.222.46.B6]AUR90823.1 hypothetical protein NVP1150O_090 [Vibrio phage 1.150.O._10N.222.46.A6]AUR90996.1 hypothetical protein NVP1152O_091 [Vibrio phage 1.152.O._10N.222.46.E1]AUS02464.1 hypothetical protein NVP2130O_090 [Vibrio phage 2.130.O._10N.222.46.C2]AUR82681.1 hypothetical protein NVP1026O_090 [Vibrio phage 1.026.O._10N.222.49.C7]